MSKQLVGLVGWRGMVGSVLMDRMQAEGDFALIEPVFFSTSNAGGKAPAMATVHTQLKDANDIAELAKCDIIITCQGGNVVGVFELGVDGGHRRGFAASVGGGEENGFDQREIAFGLHPIHQDRTDHAAPAHQAYQLLAHFTCPFKAKLTKTVRTRPVACFFFAPGTSGQGGRTTMPELGSALNGRGFVCARSPRHHGNAVG